MEIKGRQEDESIFQWGSGKFRSAGSRRKLPEHREENLERSQCRKEGSYCLLSDRQ